MWHHLCSFNVISVVASSMIFVGIVFMGLFSTSCWVMYGDIFYWNCLSNFWLHCIVGKGSSY